VWTQIYGAAGVVVAECFAVLPHALMILVTALGAGRRRACTKRPTRWAHARWRRFFTITLPGAKYGLISAALVSFTLVMTDFGIPKVIGGNFNMLATDIFQLVIGQQDFARRAPWWRLLLLAPAVLSFTVDRLRRSRRQTALLTARAVRLPAQGQSLARSGWPAAVLPGGGSHWCWPCWAWRCLPRFAKLLALQPEPDTRCTTTGWAWSTRDVECGLCQQPEDGGWHGASLEQRFGVRWRPTCWKRPRAPGQLAHLGQAAGHCCPWPCRAWCWAWASSSFST
jgi:hypothetical protein